MYNNYGIVEGDKLKLRKGTKFHISEEYDEKIKELKDITVKSVNGNIILIEESDLEVYSPFIYPEYKFKRRILLNQNTISFSTTSKLPNKFSIDIQGFTIRSAEYTDIGQWYICLGIRNTTVKYRADLNKNIKIVYNRSIRVLNYIEKNWEDIQTLDGDYTCGVKLSTLLNSDNSILKHIKKNDFVEAIRATITSRDITNVNPPERTTAFSANAVGVGVGDIVRFRSHRYLSNNPPQGGYVGEMSYLCGTVGVVTYIGTGGRIYINTITDTRFTISKDMLEVFNLITYSPIVLKDASNYGETMDSRDLKLGQNNVLMEVKFISLVLNDLYVKVEDWTGTEYLIYINNIK